MNLTDEIKQVIIDSLKQTLPVQLKKNSKLVTNQINPSDLIDRNTSPLGFSKITRKGYTP